MNNWYMTPLESWALIVALLILVSALTTWAWTSIASKDEDNSRNITSDRHDR